MDSLPELGTTFASIIQDEASNELYRKPVKTRLEAEHLVKENSVSVPFYLYKAWIIPTRINN